MNPDTLRKVSILDSRFNHLGYEFDYLQKLVSLILLKHQFDVEGYVRRQHKILKLMDLVDHKRTWLLKNR